MPSIFISRIKNIDTSFSKVEFSSKKATFTPKFDSEHGLKEYIVPIAFHPNLIAMQNNSFLRVKESSSGLTVILGESVNPITVTSLSANRAYIFLYIILLFLFLIFTKKIRNKKSG